jgi:hypothetical protein
MRTGFLLALTAVLLPAPAWAAPDDSLGMALMSAVVNDDGTLARGAGAVSSQKIDNGKVVVVFNRNVRECTYVATLGFANTNSLGIGGTVDVRGYSADVNAVLVLTSSTAPSPSNMPFHLIVFCAR